MDYSFRVGTTSYIYPDDVLPNVRKLAGVVQDVEIVLFEVDDYGSNLPSNADVEELRRIGQENDLTYTIHLPIDLDFDNPRSFEKIHRAIDATCLLNPFGYILHLDGRSMQGNPTPQVIDTWKKTTNSALQRVTQIVDPGRLYIENLETWSPDLFEALVETNGVGRCIDVGHFWKQGKDPLPHLEAHLSRTRVIHLHGVGQRDHQSLARQPRDQVERIISFLLRQKFAGVVTIEVFSADDFNSSVRIIEQVRAKWVDG